MNPFLLSLIYISSPEKNVVWLIGCVPCSLLVVKMSSLCNGWIHRFCYLANLGQAADHLLSSFRDVYVIPVQGYLVKERTHRQARWFL